jgi:hypothetical protein
MPDTVRLVEYFYIEVPDKPGEGARALAATDALTAGGGRFAAIVWVKPRDAKRASKVPGVG